MSLYDANALKSILSEQVGMKVAHQTFLGDAAVKDYLQAYPEVFSQIEVTPFEGSQMLYGHTGSGALVKIGLKEGMVQRIVIESRIPSLTRYRLVITYDGTDFFGFQTQKQERSVQSELNRIFTELHQYPTVCQGASRTDTGVHALNQVVHVDSPHTFSKEKWLMLLNQKCPKDIRIKKIDPVPPLYHARYDVKSKEYRYRLNLGPFDPFERRREWTVSGLDLTRLKTEMNTLAGTHDFTSFSKGHKEDKVRTIFETACVLQGDRVELVFVGNGFLHYMVRILVAQLVGIATGKQPLTIQELLEEKSRKHTGKIAPPQGLYLAKVNY